jgi:predicted small lipoprotein YifL
MKRKLKAITALAVVVSMTSCQGSGSNECLPTQDIILTARHQKDGSGQSKIEGSVFNQSLSKDYKDAKVRVDFYNASGENISAQEFTVEKRLSKGQAEEFSFDFMAPVGADSASWTVSCARDI